MDYINAINYNDPMYLVRIYLYNKDKLNNCGNLFIHKSRFRDPSIYNYKFYSIEGVFRKGAVNWLSYTEDFALIIFLSTLKVIV